MKYSIGRVLANLLYDTPAPLEECISKDLQKNQKGRGVFTVPMGSYLIPTEHRKPVIEYLRESQEILKQVTFLRATDGDIFIPKETGEASLTWSGLAEETSKTVGGVKLSRHTIGGSVKLSRKIVKQVRNYSDFIAKELSAAIADGLVEAILAGNGVNEPLGIMKNDTASEVYIESFLYTSRSDLMKFQVQHETENNDNGTYLMPRSSYENYQRNNIFEYKDGKILSKPVIPVPDRINGTEYNEGNDYIYYGNLADVLVAEWGTMDLTVDSWNADGSVTIYAMADFDMALKRNFVRTDAASGTLVIEGVGASFDYYNDILNVSIGHQTSSSFLYANSINSAIIGNQTSGSFNYVVQ